MSIALALPALSLAACGGGGGGSTGSTASTAGAEAHSTGATNTTTSTITKEAKPGGESNGSGGGSTESEPGPEAGAFVPRHHHDSGGGSAQFRVRGGDNSIQEFGEEAGASGSRQAATALHGFLDARAERNWAAACSYLSRDVAKSLEQLAGRSKQLQGEGCAALLAAFTKGVPASTLIEAAQADVGSLRVEGDRAFVIYRGAHNTVYAISMTEDGGSWKVAALGGTPLD